MQHASIFTGHCRHCFRKETHVLTYLLLFRPDLLLSGPSYLGIYIRETHPKCLPVMARLRLANAAPAVDVDRERTGKSRAHGGFLHVARIDVYLELRAGRLGDS